MNGRFRQYLQNHKTEFASILTQSQKDRLKPLYNKLIGGTKNLGYILANENDKVTDENLTVVIQGRVSEATIKCVNSVREFLPKSEIIVSTWDGSDTSKLNCDKVVLSPDPGDDGLIRRYPFKQINNINREITSSYAGAKVATRKYCLKIRSDMELVSNKFLKYYNCYSQYIASNAIVERRIMVEGLTTAQNRSYCVGDWWYMGCTSDIRKLFDILPYEKEPKPYFEFGKNIKKKPKGGDLVCRFIPEQYIISRFIKEHSPVEIACQVKIDNTYDEGDLEFYREFLAGNLMCLEFPESGIILPKAQNMNSHTSYHFGLHFFQWFDLCRTYHAIPNKKPIKPPKKIFKEHNRNYLNNPRFFDLQNMCFIIDNYSKRSEVKEINTNNTIKDEDITFVVCGLAGKYGGFDCITSLTSIRNNFPRSKIIFATWKSESVKKIKKELYDEILVLDTIIEDEISTFMCGSGQWKLNSINKQQYMVNCALKLVKTKYAVKTRTDIIIANRNFLEFYSEWSNKLDQTDCLFNFFKERVLSLTHFTTYPRYADFRFTCTCSDIFNFGLTEDLMLMWDGHMETRQTFNYFNEHPNSVFSNPCQFNHKYNAEQYFLINVIKKKLPKAFIPVYYYDNSDDRVTFEYEKIVASNLLLADFKQLGLNTKFNSWGEEQLFTFDKFLYTYLSNVDPTNQKCLEYLKAYFEIPKVSGLIGVTNLFSKSVHSILSAFKFVLRCVLPAYRVGYGTRDILMHFQTEQRDSINYLNFKIDDLTRQLNNENKEIMRLRMQLSALEDEKNDKVE